MTLTAAQVNVLSRLTQDGRGVTLTPAGVQLLVERDGRRWVVDRRGTLARVLPIRGEAS